MKRTYLKCLGVFLFFLGLEVGCNAPVVPSPGDLVQSEKSRQTDPQVDSSDLGELVLGNSNFALDLYSKLCRQTPKENIFYSPYSLSLALAMTSAGAKNQTEKEMADTLHLMDQGRLHPAVNALDLDLAGRGQNALGIGGQPFRLNIVNALWSGKGYTFLPEFLDTLAVNYGAGIRLLDFTNQPEESRKTINQWVSYNTQEKIPEILPAGVITADTRLVLTNAIYFNAAWKKAFDPAKTSDGKFNQADGTILTVSMMNQQETFNYDEADGYQAVELPYDGEEMSMVIFLPAEKRFSEFEESLNTEKINTILGRLKMGQVLLTLPTLKLTCRFGLNDTLAQMGMPTPFTDAADFSGMNGMRGLFITDIIHQAYVLVNEKGTEAAAATGVIVGLTSAGPGTCKVFTADRPFIFLIRDIKTNTILFVGRIMNSGV
jgi:serpin B